VTELRRSTVDVLDGAESVTLFGIFAEVEMLSAVLGELARFVNVEFP
jgi:hypothetical protein